MPDLLHVLLLFGVGLLAGVINVMAGGGSALTLPVLIFLNLDPTVANGTNRVAIVAQNIFATLSFHRQKVSRTRQSLLFAAWAVPGAIVGAIAAVQISDAWFLRILGVVMLGVVVSVVVPRKARETTLDGRSSPWIYPLLFGIGFYGGFIQMGVGFLFMAGFYHVMRMNLVFANMHKVVVALLYSLPALSIFAVSGNVDWALGLVLATGNALGAWFAAQVMVQRGEKLVRTVLVVALLIMAAKILGLY